jgi:hypothetical protein
MSFAKLWVSPNIFWDAFAHNFGDSDVNVYLYFKIKPGSKPKCNAGGADSI